MQVSIHTDKKSVIANKMTLSIVGIAPACNRQLLRNDVVLHALIYSETCHFSYYVNRSEFCGIAVRQVPITDRKILNNLHSLKRYSSVQLIVDHFLSIFSWNFQNA